LNLRPRAPFLTVALAAVAVAGCGSSSSSTSTATPPATPAAPSTPATPSTPKAPASTSAGGSKLSLAADPSGQLQYVQKSLTAKAGKVTIDFANQSSIAHDVAVAKGATALGTSPVIMGSTTSLTLTLAKGTYTFYCSVDGHRMAGMQGTLTVN
jgi:plastocyanin